MNFDLRRPCGQCPFRNDIEPFIRPARAREILHCLTAQQGTFACHKTTQGGTTEQHCAGAMILLEKMGRPNQMMRIMERMRAYDHRNLDMTAPVYRTPLEMIRAHQKAERNG